MDYFSTRATVRNYTDREIPDHLLQSIVARAVKAPTTGGMQLYSVIVTRDPEKRKALAEAHFNQPAATGCKAILTVCADFNRFSRWCRISNADPGYDNFLSFTSAMIDAVVLTQQIVTIAEMEGLGTCYLGTVTYNADKISSLLQLPDLVVPVASISLGYPAGSPEQTERLPLEAVMYQEKYPVFSDVEIKELYRAKDDFAPNQKFIEENGKQTLAQVFTDIRYPKSMNEAVSASLLQLLRCKGFLPE